MGRRMLQIDPTDRKKRILLEAVKDTRVGGLTEEDAEQGGDR